MYICSQRMHTVNCVYSESARRETVSSQRVHTVILNVVRECAQLDPTYYS
jgi:hypothetical protein